MSLDRLEVRDILSLTDEYDLFLFDLWGVIVEGEELYAGVVDKVNKIIESGKEVFFLSNAPRPVLSSYNRIKSWGIKAEETKVMTSGELAREYIFNSLEKLNITSPVVYHLGSDRNDEITKGFENLLTEDVGRANIILMTLYRDEGEDLNEKDGILKLIADLNIITLCANPDTTIPRQETIRYNAGYFSQKIEELGGKVIYTGKPGEEIYRKILDKFPHIDKNRILMIGDTLETDILGARGVGINSALVMTGNAKKFHADYSSPEEKYDNISKAVRKATIIPSFIGIL